jgi:L-lactate dehydrogenase complex protein LldG
VEALALVAETGSLLLALTEETTPWSTALLPPVQRALARASSLVSSLEEGLWRASEAGAPHVILVAGPSRTADVEKTLVVPAHGPRELHLVVLLD